jgi:hypothetical protein
MRKPLFRPKALHNKSAKKGCPKKSKRRIRTTTTTVQHWADENHVAKVASISSHFCSGVLSDEKIFLLA